MSYGQMPQAQYHHRVTAGPRNGLGIAVLVLGLVALALSFIPFVSLFTAIPLGITGGILAIFGLIRVGKRIATNKAMTIIGMIASILAVVIAVASTTLTTLIIGAAGAGSGDSRSTSSAAPFIEPTASAEGDAPLDQFPGQTADDIVGTAGDELESRGLKVKADELRSVNDTFGKQLCSKVTIKNDGASTARYNAFDWKLQYPSGDTKETSVSGEDPLYSGEIAPGGEATGSVCYDDTGESGKYVLINEEAFDFSNERAAWINEID